MLRQAGQFGGLADEFSPRGVDAAAFGTLDVASQLAELAVRLDAASRGQFCAAERFLRGVERRLETVRQAIIEAEKANVSAIRAR